MRNNDGSYVEVSENHDKTFNLERFQDLKSSQAYTDNHPNNKTVNITFRSNFKNLAERTMGGGFGGYGNTIAGYTRQNQDKGGAIIGKQINGLGQGVPRSWIGQKYNYKGKYNDIDSFL